MCFLPARPSCVLTWSSVIRVNLLQMYPSRTHNMHTRTHTHTHTHTHSWVSLSSEAWHSQNKSTLGQPSPAPPPVPTPPSSGWSGRAPRVSSCTCQEGWSASTPCSPGDYHILICVCASTACVVCLKYNEYNCTIMGQHYYFLSLIIH